MDNSIEKQLSYMTKDAEQAVNGTPSRGFFKVLLIFFDAQCVELISRRISPTDPLQHLHR